MEHYFQADSVIKQKQKNKKNYTDIMCNIIIYIQIT